MAMTVGEVVKELPSVLFDMYENHVIKHFKVLAPTVLHINVNLRCNTQCAMCNIWELKSSDQLSPEQLKAVFADPVYARVEYIMLAGGEPTLRHDLPDIVELRHAAMPRLKKLLIASNVIHRASVEAQYPRIARYCVANNIRLSLGVSLDGIGATHDRVRDVKGAFDKVMESIAFMKQLQHETPFNMSLDPTIFSMNVHEMQQLQNLADRLDLPITFQFASVADDYYHNSYRETSLSLDNHDKQGLMTFLQHRIAESSLFDALAYYYEEVVAQTHHPRPRQLPCPFADQGVLLNPDGSLQYCHNSRPIGNALTQSSSELYFSAQNLAYRNQVQQEVCPSCQMSCLFFVSLRKEVAPFLSFIAKRLLRKLRSHVV